MRVPLRDPFGDLFGTRLLKKTRSAVRGSRLTNPIARLKDLHYKLPLKGTLGFVKRVTLKVLKHYDGLKNGAACKVRVIIPFMSMVMVGLGFIVRTMRVFLGFLLVILFIIMTGMINVTFLFVIVDAFSYYHCYYCDFLLH